MLPIKKFYLDKIAKIKKLFTFGKKKASVEGTRKPMLSYDELLKQKNRSIEKYKPISKSEYQRRLDKILQECLRLEVRCLEICDLFFEHPMSYVDKKYAKNQKTSTKKSIFRKKDDKVSEPFIVEYKKPTVDKKQKRINDFLEDLYDKDQRSCREIADLTADAMLAATKAEETDFVDTWEKYLKRTKKEPNSEAFKTFLVSNQKFTKNQLKMFQVSATFISRNLVNYNDFKEEMKRVKSL